ncbi:MAG: MBL fold metallo-hydrolase [Dehalococcoidales bacterium]|nr:MBL fold metallo-hydrolase [Dehalococcoidales bacterium]
MKDKTPPGETVTFLGTGGARFMIISQLLATGGLWLNLNGTQILVDPGPGCIIQATKRKLDAEKLSAIIISHRHLDHSADVNIMVEAMTQGGHNRHGRFFAPADALDNEPVIFSYLKERLEGVEILREGGSYTIGDVSFSTPVRHIHLVETYGMVFRTPAHTFSYIADSRYFDGLCRHYGGELLIINVAFLEPKLMDPRMVESAEADNSQFPGDHISVPDAERIIRKLKPGVAIMTHFGMSMWRAKPWQIAEKLSEKTGVKVIAARDGMKFDLAQVDNIRD